MGLVRISDNGTKAGKQQQTAVKSPVSLGDFYDKLPSFDPSRSRLAEKEPGKSRDHFRDFVPHGEGRVLPAKIIRTMEELAEFGDPNAAAKRAARILFKGRVLANRFRKEELDMFRRDARALSDFVAEATGFAGVLRTDINGNDPAYDKDRPSLVIYQLNPRLFKVPRPRFRMGEHYTWEELFSPTHVRLIKELAGGEFQSVQKHKLCRAGSLSSMIAGQLLV